jgi:HlyD family secretion protein
MALFRKISFYLAIFGIVTLIALVKTMNAATVPLVKPAVNPYQSSLAASGIIEALDRNVALGAPIDGVVLSVMVHVGDRVKKGAELFKIDERDLQAQLLVQEANLTVAEANLKRLEDQLQRLNSVKDPRAVSQEDIQTRANDVAVAKAQLNVAECQVKQTQLLIKRATICAPIDGVVLQNNLREGEYFTAKSMPAMLLGNTDRLQVRVDIDEQNACRFKENLTAIAYPKNNTSKVIQLKFDHLEPYVLPKKSLTGSSSERVDTRVLQVIYTFERTEDLNVYVGQQVDIYIQEDSLG